MSDEALRAATAWDRDAASIALRGLAEMVKREGTRWRLAERAALLLLFGRYLKHHRRGCGYCRWSTCAFAEALDRMTKEGAR